MSGDLKKKEHIPLVVEQRILLSLDDFRKGVFYTLKQAAQRLDHADARSLRKWIRVFTVPTYICRELNGSAVLIRHEDLALIAKNLSRQLVDEETEGDSEVDRLLQRISELETALSQEKHQQAKILSQINAQHASELARYRERIAQLEVQVKQLSEARDAQEYSEEILSQVSPRSHGSLPRLPRGFAMLDAFAKKHAISLENLEQAIQIGEVPVVEGNWRYGQVRVTRALDRDGQRAFHQKFLGTDDCDRCMLDRQGYISLSPPK
jgi:hypothetical protein